jgi:protein-S-isoprenylcysteine O-methyltransferase Ste14
MKTLFDWPPLWLFACLALAYGLRQPEPWPLIGMLRGGLAIGFVGLGLLLMALAAWEMMRARTTVIPRQKPSALVTSGIFQFSRNPIYLGDALILLGAIIWWQTGLALPLVPAFMLVIHRRFIRGEETALRSAFPDEFDLWAARVRRWI